MTFSARYKCCRIGALGRLRIWASPRCVPLGHSMQLCRKELKKRLFHRGKWKLDGVPAEAFALLFGYFLKDGQRLRTAVLSAGGEDGVNEGDGGGIRGAEGSGFDAG